MTLTIREALRQTAARLSASPRFDDNAELCARLLLCHCLDCAASRCYSHPEQPLLPQQLERLNDLAARCGEGEPVAYLIGQRAFWSLDLLVTPAVLIPRPETELLVERMLATLPDDRPLSIIDLGTGSGAIAAALASERPHWRITATDISLAALQLARRNFARLGLAVQLLQGFWLSPIKHGPRFDAIASNPPYIASQDPHLNNLDREPQTALQAGPDGMRDLALLIDQAGGHLRPDGWLFLEHGWDQGDRVRRRLRACGYRQVATHRDLAGLDRLTAAQAPAD